MKNDEVALYEVIARAERAWTRRVDAALADLGVTRSQLRVLGAVIAEPGAWSSALARTLAISTPTMSIAVDGLIKARFIRREALTYGRAVSLQATAEGNRIFDAATKALTRLERGVAGELGHTKPAQCAELLERVIAALGKGAR